MKRCIPAILLMMISLADIAHADARRVQITMEAAKEGDAAAQNRLGVFYEIGASIEQSDTEAVKWFRMAADQEHGEAQYNLGEMYEQGRGVQKNIQEAIALYKKSCANGCKCACKRYRLLTGEEKEAPEVTF
ncbi:MAG: sel1 repeat family protein [Chlorobiaceae bacterium]|nr:sel1 repeat family protein [Chlorobiaceae bacterium]